MKKITFLFMTMIAMVVFISSCEKKEADPIFDMNKTKAPAISEPAGGASYVLTQDSVGAVMATFKWSATSYNLTDLGSPIYSLQIDRADSSFKNARELTSTSETSFSLTVGAMNSRLLSLGFEPDVEGEVEVRLMSFLASNAGVSTIYSSPVKFSVTAYSGVVDVPKLWVPGAYQGWNPALAPVIYDFDNDGIFTGYLYFPEDASSFEFKFTSHPNWENTNYGQGAAPGQLDTDPGAGNLMVPGPGGYQVIVNTNTLTWSYTAQSWGVIGQWLNWAEDIDMLWDAANQQLYVTVENIPAASNQRFKFRANDAWTVNLGAKDPDDGTLVQGGADIFIIDGGTITFYLRFTTPEPTYEIE